MKAIIPVSGVGTRLRPHTYTAPKVLLQVAGKPIIAHILDELVTIGIEEVTFVVGYLGDLIKEYINENYAFQSNYVHQEKLLGLGHAIWLARGYHENDDEVLIILGDTIFHADLSSVMNARATQIGVKEVDDPRRFGIAEIEGEYISRVVEKPAEPKTNLAIVGIYKICNPRVLFGCLDENIKADKKTKGEFQLTDALQKMIARGEKMQPFRVEGWYDCGKPETLLLTNRDLLQRNNATSTPGKEDWGENSIINHPVFIHPSAHVENAIVGPFVTVAADAHIENAIITNSIIGKKAMVQNIILTDSLISDNAKAEGRFNILNVGDTSEVNFT